MKRKLMAIIDHIERLSANYYHVLIVLIGLLLLLAVYREAKPASLQELSTFADTMLKLLGVVVIGMLLPRIASLKLWGAEVTLKADAERLAVTVNALEGKVARLEAMQAKGQAQVGAEEKPAREPPKLGMKRVVNDQQKGRFGGLPSNGDYTLSASFPDGRSSGDFVRVRLSVDKKTGGLTEPVRFFLHESFRPNDIIAVLPKDGAAVLDLIVYGGFTVGAWPEETAGTLLELDLANLKDAPRAVRER